MTDSLNAANPNRVCVGMTARGPCQAPPRTGRDYCFAHDPDSAEKAAHARRRGGYGSRQYASAEFENEKPPQTIEEIQSLMTRIGAAAMRKEVDPKTANTAINACRVALAAMQLAQKAGKSSPEPESSLAELIKELDSYRPD